MTNLGNLCFTQIEKATGLQKIFCSSSIKRAAGLQKNVGTCEYNSREPPLIKNYIIGRPDKGTSVISLTTATAATAMFPNWGSSNI